MVRDAEEHAADDKKRRDLIEAKNSADSIVYRYADITGCRRLCTPFVGKVQERANLTPIHFDLVQLVGIPPGGIYFQTPMCFTTGTFAASTFAGMALSIWQFITCSADGSTSTSK